MPVRTLLYRNVLFLGIAGTLGVLGVGLNWSLPEPGAGAILLNVLAGVMVVAGLFTGWGSYLLGADRRALERLCRGDKPLDGCLEAVSGSVTTDGDPLVSPFTGTTCAAYEYSVHRVRRASHGSGAGNRRRALCFDGRHMTDLFLDGSPSRVRIASMPSLEEFVSEEPSPELARELGERLQDGPRVGILGYLRQRRASNRSNYRRLARDWYLSRPGQWDESVELDERALPTGVTVCAIGVWNERATQLETPYPWRFSRISVEPGEPGEVRKRIGEGAYQLARISLWCLGLGYAMLAVMPVIHLFR
jgi:hypothetical protein